MGGILGCVDLGGDAGPAPDGLVAKMAWRGEPRARRVHGGWIAAFLGEEEDEPLAAEGPLSVLAHGRLFGADVRPAARRVLEAYVAKGEDGLVELDGEAAFLLWDEERRTLLASRDTFGLRPLFVGRSGDRIAVSSSPSLVPEALGRGGDVDEAEVNSLVGRGQQALERTIYSGVERLLPSRLVAFESGRPSRFRLNWQPPRNVDWSVKTEDAALELPNVIRRSIERRRWLRPVLALSGGVDSPAVGATVWGTPGLESRVSGGGGLPAMTLAFPEKSWDEEARARAVADRFGVPLSVIDGRILDPFDGALELAKMCSQPLPGETGHHLLLLFGEARRLGCRTVVTGFGGDGWLTGSELAGADALLRGRVRRSVGIASADARSRGRSTPWQWNYRTFRPCARFVLECRLRLMPPRPAFAGAAAFGLWDDAETATSWNSVAWRAGHELLSGLFASSLPECIEEVAARNGVTISAPLLDRELAEFVSRIPPERLNPGRTYKELARAGLRGSLPELLLDGRRVTFDDEVAPSRARALDWLGPRAGWHFSATKRAAEGSAGGAPRWEEIALELWRRTRV